jgi:hypothetical protein
MGVANGCCWLLCFDVCSFHIFFFVPLHPSHIGLVIEDMTANELLIATAIENKDVFNKVLIDNNPKERS